jgi:hypothetical protein
MMRKMPIQMAQNLIRHSLRDMMEKMPTRIAQNLTPERLFKVLW